MSSAGGSVASSLSAAGSVARYSLGMPVACQKVPHPGSRTGPGRMERVTDERRLAGPAQVPAHEPLLDADGIERLREAMRASRYTSAGIADRIGPAGDRGPAPQRPPRGAAGPPRTATRSGP